MRSVRSTSILPDPPHPSASFHANHNGTMHASFAPLPDEDAGESVVHTGDGKVPAVVCQQVGSLASRAGAHITQRARRQPRNLIGVQRETPLAWSPDGERCVMRGCRATRLVDPHPSAWRSCPETAPSSSCGEIEMASCRCSHRCTATRPG